MKQRLLFGSRRARFAGSFPNTKITGSEELLSLRVARSYAITSLVLRVAPEHP